MALSGVKDDLLFIVNTSKYTLEIKDRLDVITFPEPNDHTDIKELYNPTLLNKLTKDNITPNDLFMSEDARSFILTGPNSGGKTVYVNSIAIAQIMFQLGMPVPAKFAKMKSFDTVATMYIHSTEISNDGRLADETKRLKECLSKLTDNSLLLLDETFSGTSAYDGVFLAESLIKYLYKHNIFHMYITHFHELTLHIDSLRQEEYNIVILSAQNIESKRTYKIITNEKLLPEKSLAKDIISEHGLGFLFE